MIRKRRLFPAVGMEQTFLPNLIPKQKAGDGPSVGCVRKTGLGLFLIGHPTAKGRSEARPLTSRPYTKGGEIFA